MLLYGSMHFGLTNVRCVQTESPSMHLCSQSGAESGGLCRETGILGPSGLDARPGQRWRHSALEMVPTDTQRSAATPALSARGCAASSQPPAEKDETARRLNAKRRASSACERPSHCIVHSSSGDHVCQARVDFILGILLTPHIADDVREAERERRRDE